MPLSVLCEGRLDTQGMRGIPGPFCLREQFEPPAVAMLWLSVSHYWGPEVPFINYSTFQKHCNVIAPPSTDRDVQAWGQGVRGAGGGIKSCRLFVSYIRPSHGFDVARHREDTSTAVTVAWKHFICIPMGLRLWLMSIDPDYIESDWISWSQPKQRVNRDRQPSKLSYWTQGHEPKHPFTV